MSGIIDRTVTVGNDSYDYIQFGKGHENLVMIPGVGDGLVTVKGKAYPFAFLFREFGKRFRVTVISRKNRLENDATTLTMAHDQADAMKALGIEKAHIVGVSQGGMIAQHLAAFYPEMVERLVLVVTVPKASELMKTNAEIWKNDAIEGRYRHLMIDTNEKSHPERILKRTRWMYMFFHDGNKKIKDVKRYVIQCNSCMTHDATPYLEKISCPTLVIGGSEDNTLGMEGSYILHERINGSILICYPGQGHGLYSDEKRFNSDVIHFLSQK